MKTRKFLAILVTVMMLSTVTLYAIAIDDEVDTDTQAADDGAGQGDLYIVEYAWNNQRTLGLTGLNGGGEFFPMHVKNTVTGDEFYTFCANGGCENFANDNKLGCKGYVVGTHASPVIYNALVAALNYIEDNIPGGLYNEFNRPITQTTVWSILGFVSTDFIEACSSLNQAEKNAVLKAIDAGWNGYTGAGSVVDFIYLVCENPEHGATSMYCQPQIVPLIEYKGVINEEWTEPTDPTEDPGTPTSLTEDPGTPTSLAEDPNTPTDTTDSTEPTDTTEPTTPDDINKPEDPEDGDDAGESEDDGDADESDSSEAIAEEVAGDEEFEAAVPLAELPEDLTIEDTDVPLSMMPQTGVDSSIGLWLAGLGLSLAAGGAAATVFCIKKEDTEV